MNRSSHRVRVFYWKSDNDTGTQCLGDSQEETLEFSSRKYWGQESRPDRDDHGWIVLQDFIVSFPRPINIHNNNYLWDVLDVFRLNYIANKSLLGQCSLQDDPPVGVGE